MSTKICLMCKQEKPVECFSRNRTQKDGLDKYCKSCISIQSRQYRERHEEEIKARKKAAYYREKANADERTAKEMAIGHKVCTGCGIDKPITDFYKRGNGGFYSRCKKCHCEDTMAYVQENYDIVIARKRRYHKTHKAQIDAYNRQYYKDHKDEVRERVRIWEEANPEQARENQLIGVHHRRSKKAGLKSSFTRIDWRNCKEAFSVDGIVHCAYCGKPIKKATIDHVIPFNAGGENTIRNIVPACMKCNASKFNHPLEEWYRKQPFYSEEREKRIKTYLNY